MRKIFLVTDYTCNNACISCAKKSDEKGRLSLEQIVEKIELVKPSPEDFIEISGGEPTLRRDIFAICEYIKSKHGTNLVILSNGRKFRDISFAKKLKQTGVDRVMTTFYSPYEEKHDLITQREGSFSDTVRGLKNLESIGVPISAKTIILEQNYRELPDFVDFAYKSFHSAWVSIHGLILRGVAKDNSERIVAKYHKVKPYIEDAIEKAIKLNKNLGVFIVPSCILDPSYWSYLSVNWRQITKEMVYISPKETIFGNLDVALPNYCSECLVGKDCSWAWESAWKEYIDLFGTEELKRVTPSQLRFES